MLMCMQCPETGEYTCGSALGGCSCGPGYKYNSSTKECTEVDTDVYKPPSESAVAIDDGSNKLKLTWKAQSNDDTVFRYNLSLTKYNPNSNAFVSVPGSTVRAVKVYGGNSDGLNGDSSGYSLDTGIVPKLSDVYQLQISTTYLDGVESSPVTVSSPTPQVNPPLQAWM